MFVNKVPFLVTLSHALRFGMVSALPNRQTGTIVMRLKQTIRLYQHRRFRIRSLFADSEFELMRPSFPFLETAGADDHIPTIERYIRTIKDRTRSAWHSMLFSYTPQIIIIHLVQNAVFWLNAFPAQNGISSQHSPRYIMTGRLLDTKLHARLQFGEYVQMHEEHSNDMNAWTTRGICLGPTGSSNGSHKFMSLASGKSVTRTRWTALPMPSEVIKRVNFMGKTQGMPVHVHSPLPTEPGVRYQTPSMTLHSGPRATTSHTATAMGIVTPNQTTRALGLTTAAGVTTTTTMGTTTMMTPTHFPKMMTRHIHLTPMTLNPNTNISHWNTNISHQNLAIT